MKILAVFLVCWVSAAKEKYTINPKIKKYKKKYICIFTLQLGHVTAQSSADYIELEIGSRGEGPPEKTEFPWGNDDQDLEATF